jgi:hypothetical protein
MGIEPTPKAWQAFVLPLYYGRPTLSFYSTFTHRPQADLRAHVRAVPFDGSKKQISVSGLLGELADPGALDHGRLSLPFGEASSLVAVRVDAAEFFPVRVVHSNEPVMMPAATIITERSFLPFLFQDSSPE